MNKFYVYVHRKESDNSIFYVGKGTGSRAYDQTHRSEYWKRIFNKHGRLVEIVKAELDETSALAFEMQLINRLKSDGIALCNLTDGGDGCKGFEWSDESRDKISKLMKGKAKSEDHREKLSKANTGKKQTDITIEKRKATFNERMICKDKNIYVFFSESDVFIGTRKELSVYSGLPTKSFTKLFSQEARKSSFGWSVLKFNELLILKEIQNDYCNRY